MWTSLEAQLRKICVIKPTEKLCPTAEGIWGKTLVSVTKEGLDSPEDAEERKQSFKSSAKSQKTSWRKKPKGWSCKINWPMLQCHKHEWLDRKHGKNPQGPSPKRQLNNGLYGSKETPGNKPESFQHQDFNIKGRGWREVQVCEAKIWSSCSTKLHSCLPASVWNIPDIR